MESFIKNIKKKLSVDNIVDMMKESKVIDDNSIKEEDVRKTLQKIDPNSLMDVDELAAKLNEISEDISKATESTTVEKTAGKIIIEAAKSGLNALKKPTQQEETPSTENDFLSALNKEDNVFNLNDDFN
ncbi:unnamed protein product [Chilo suppressalis]|uniref:Uncharacterized protein n=1 Tax=Chilo suppressalis TaxID=168631 RepID=A0ABN8AZN2_CHISP|nr:unnamed protein product [Chilo suppressalis]